MHPTDSWDITQIGQGMVTHEDTSLKLTIPPASAEQYHDAQISDYTTQKLNFKHRPPIRLSLWAKATGRIHGTAGFGFWNLMFVPNERGFRIPQAVWFFFGSPPNNIALAKGVKGHGWKAATFNAQQWQFYGLLPLAPFGFLVMRNRYLYDKLWDIGQSAIGVSETALDMSLLKDFHQYTIDWLADGARFAVDGQTMLETDSVPTKPLGFIAWVDNQYAIVTPQGNFGWGLLDVPQAQSLTLRDIQIESL